MAAEEANAPEMKMQDVLWQPSDGSIGLEHARIGIRDGVVAESMLIAIDDSGVPYRLQYFLMLDEGWNVKLASIGVTGDDQNAITLQCRQAGRWEDGAGNIIPELEGCTDMDITATPLTNTLPIRRLAWRPLQSAEIDVAYVVVPAMRLERRRQRYTCLRTLDNGGLFRFEALDTGFTADITVDEQGLVVDYPGLFKRLSTR